MSKIKIQNTFFIIILVVLSLTFFRIISSLFVAIIIAVVLSLLLRYPFKLLNYHWGISRPISTLIIFLGLITFVSIPLTIIIFLVLGEVEEAIHTIRVQWPQILDWLGDILPGLRAIVTEYQLETRIADFFSNALTQIINISQVALSSAVGAVFLSVIALYLVFFLLLEGDKFAKQIYKLLPIAQENINQLLIQATKTLDATVISTLVIGFVEATFGSLLFLILGFPSPTFWGLIMFFASVLPLIGINAIILPTGIVAILLGNYSRGLILIILGIAGTIFSQNILKPKLIGDRTGLHPALVLVSTIGGISWLGLICFLVGPIIATLFVVIWEQFATQRENNKYI